MNGYITADGADYLINIFTGKELAAPTYYLALITGGQPGISAHGNELDEPAVSEYIRASIDNLSGNWLNQPQQGLINVDAAFPVASVDWGTVRYWALCDSEQDGRVLLAGDLDPFDVVAGQQVIVTAGSLGISIDLDDWTE
jgi:hypothetical protein